MRAEDFGVFSEIIEDLGAAFNKPVSERVMRVFFEDLKPYHLGTVRNRAMLWRKTGKKFPTPNDLRPQEQVQDDLVRPKSGKVEPTIQERLCAFAAFHYAPHKGRTTPWQFGQPWKYLYKRHQWTDKHDKSRDEPAICVGVVIPAAPDGSRPSYRIMVEDMDAQVAA